MFVTEFLISGVYTAPLWFTPIVISSWFLTQYIFLLINIFQFFDSINTKILQFGVINTEKYYRTAYRRLLCDSIPDRYYLSGQNNNVDHMLSDCFVYFVKLVRFTDTLFGKNKL